MRIAVVGGGIGGLCLAHGLRKADVDVAVYEREFSRTDRLQGYRVHINPHGAAALRECLPAANWARFEQSAGSSDNGFGFLTEQLKPLLVLDQEEEKHYSASRITLRQVLLDGLDVQFGKRFERYEHNGDGITLHFEDGTTAECDVLVGADGIRSRVRKQYLPHAGTEDVGVTAIAGKLFLDEHDWIPQSLLTRANSVIPTSRCGMFLVTHDGLGYTDDDGVLFDNVRPYLMWAYAAKDLDVHNGLQAEVLRRIAGWSPDLRRVVELSHPETVSQWHIRSSKPIERWESTNVTLLGDAIHAMTPMRGIGANIALRDAQLLARCITEGGDAIARYEAEMYDYGFAAVRDSLRAARQFAERSPVSRTLFRTVLRTAAAVPALKRAMF
ncbi:FAD-dependent monooxygenase [Lentzea sp. NEAU-D13]|uniref:FAD-dependent monooxygenase n=1 Tax=Lentzea alba TaxID=2714351 RepID=A0A7C9RXM0_9PSEU|nr:NAD(P)/FAD-dependent oxidoreductase [Lentzea alba]NGY65404.1 FAD-dependent monooxygenase [Lentzea alba]